MKSNSEIVSDLRIEYAELAEKADKLDDFMVLHGLEIGKRQYHTLRDQQSAMWAYAGALKERIHEMEGEDQ